MICTLIADTHWLIKDMIDRKRIEQHLTGGECIIHAGDVSGRGTIPEVKMFLEWFSKLKYKHKILIAGNHDFLFETRPDMAADLLSEYPDIIYLNDSAVTIDGINFWGSPITPWFHNWAFNRTADEIQVHWDMIPENTDVLITHGPPRGIHDWTIFDRKPVGCPMLLDRVMQIKPQLHVFGHIHEGQGQTVVGDTTFINASMVDHRYDIYDRKPFLFEAFPKVVQ